jgi:large subunit ribosomal protein L13
MKTFMAKKEDIKRKWFLVDAKGQILGRLATRIAIVLRGKHKPEYTPHVDCGDGVIVINADKIKVTGKKADEKTYASYSGYSGGYKVKTFSDLMKKDSAKIIWLAVKRMIPDTPLGRDMVKKLKVYAGEDYPQKVQKPEELKLVQ